MSILLRTQADFRQPFARGFAVVARFNPVSLFANGESGALYDISNADTLYQETTGAAATTPAGVGDPVGTVLDLSGNGNHAVAPNDAGRSTFADNPKRLAWDQVDDNLQLDIPAGGLGGTMIAATDIGMVPVEVSIPAGVYNLVAGNGVFPNGRGDLIGMIFRSPSMSVQEITAARSYLTTLGAPFDYSGTTDLSVAFRDRADITAIGDIGDTGNISDFNRFVYECNALASLDVSDWDTSSVTSFSNFAFRCNALTALDVSGWDTSSVATFQNFLYECTTLTALDVRGWDTSSVVDFSRFILRCRSLPEIDISNWDTSSVTDFKFFAFESDLLVTITVGNAFANSPCLDYSRAFEGCALDQQSVNDILVSINNAGTSNGTLGINGGTNAAPSGAGATAVSNLQARGWTVTTN